MGHPPEGHPWRKRLVVAAAILVPLLVLAAVVVAVVYGFGTRGSGQQLQGYVQSVPKSSCEATPSRPKELKDPKYPALGTGVRPNFIYLFVDDMGFDDLAVHHPENSPIRTPNMDRLVHSGMEFSNFYTTPMCSMSRSELLTGRYYPRTGSMYINTGWDYINRDESTIAHFLGKAGYSTAHFGKWHNGRTPGYMPVDFGFQHSWMPTPYIYYNTTINYNGNAKKTTGWMEQALMTRALQYLKEHEQGEEPFYVYYPFFSVHAGRSSAESSERFARPAPPEYADKYLAIPGLAPATAKLYGMLEYVDEQIGRLLDFLDASPLGANTYVFLSGDNGPALFNKEGSGANRDVRMPSGMRGFKEGVFEGGIRNTLVVRGPGVHQGVTSYTLSSLMDVTPTIAELAGVTPPVADKGQLPWTGISLAGVIKGGETTVKQQERMLFSMSAECVEDDFVPLLGPDGHTLKPQALLDYYKGGVSGLGFRRCLGVRYKQYKWVANATLTRGQGPNNQGYPSALYKFPNPDNHIELPCHEVSKAEATTLFKLENAALAWFERQRSQAHAFEKAAVQIGTPGREAYGGVPGDLAAERTPERVKVLPFGLRGFAEPGDKAMFKAIVMTRGNYKVQLVAVQQHAARVKVMVGLPEELQAGTAPQLVVQLPSKSASGGSVTLGTMDLTKTPPNQTHHILFELVSNNQPGQPVFAVVDHLHFSLIDHQPLPADDVVIKQEVIDKAAGRAAGGSAAADGSQHTRPDVADPDSGAAGAGMTEAGPLAGVEGPAPPGHTRAAEAAATAVSDDFMLAQQEGVAEWKEKHPEYRVGR